jgi:putative salt-induced outer membrane protein YdiY
MHTIARFACALGVASLLASPSFADKVTVKGTTLEGTVLSVTKTTVEMKTVYGDGTLKLKIEDVSRIETDGVLRLFHGDEVTEAQALDVAGGTLTAPGASIPVATLDAVQNTTPGKELGILDRIALQYPYWSGNFDLAFNYTDSTINSLSIASGLALKREKAPTRFLLAVNYLRSTSEDDEGNDEGDVHASELRGMTRFEYDLSPRWFAFGSAEAEHDRVERLSVRAIPKVGMGYKLWTDAEKNYFAVDGGTAWVYERFFGGDTNDYWSLAVGAETSVKLGYGWIWFARLDYLPSVEDWLDDFILRGETSLLFPLTEHFALKTSLIDLYDSTPAEGSESNSLQMLVGASVLF